MSKAIVCFKYDLRLSDHLPLSHAIKNHDDVIPLYIFDEKNGRPLGAAQRCWLHHSLTALNASILKRGATLLCRQGDTKKVLLALIAEHHIDAVYWHKNYEPALIHYEKTLEETLLKKGVHVKTFEGYLLSEPWKIKNKSGGYFKVFTPYWHTLRQTLIPADLLPAPKKIPQKTRIHGDDINQWHLLPSHPDWSHGILKTWKISEDAAKNQMNDFFQHHIQHYSMNRDKPPLDSTSHLSPYLHFGQLSAHQVWHAAEEAMVHEKKHQKDVEKFMTELGWREFSYHLLYHYPELPKKNFRSEFDQFHWEKNSRSLACWQRGHTGYPIVDAGMRELWETGYMHNRVRMIVASFLIKDLLIDWREGEAWFWDTLVDADLANNVGNWQWVAGCGADAAPYFRIFNPVLQGEKFDPEGLYVKKWVPELKMIPSRYVHKPWEMPENILKTLDFQLGRDYPHPMVDHAEARAIALKKYKHLTKK